MKKILFTAHDPGGINVLGPVIDSFAEKKEYAVSLLLLGPAQARYQRTGKKCHALQLTATPVPGFVNELNVDEGDVVRLLSEHPFDCLFTATSYNSNLERLLLRQGKINKIPTMAILDFWANYSARFTLHTKTVFPDIVFVADARMSRELLLAGCTSEVVVCGNPYLRGLSLQYKKIPASLPPGKTVFRFFSENIVHYFPEQRVNEFTIVAELIESLEQAGCDCSFVIRRHPMESPEPWERFILDYRHGGKRGRHVDLSLDTLDFTAVLSQTSVAIGLASMALLETVVCGIPTFSYQIHAHECEGSFHLPYEEHGITRLKSKKDLSLLVNPVVMKGRYNGAIQNQPTLEIIHRHVNAMLK